MNIKRVTGRKAGNLMLYALSTCIWCRKTKELLSSLGVEYDYIDVDLLKGAEREAAVNEIMKHNPSRSFPTLVIDGDKCIVGFQEEEIRGALKL